MGLMGNPNQEGQKNERRRTRGSESGHDGGAAWAVVHLGIGVGEVGGGDVDEVVNCTE